MKEKEDRFFFGTDKDSIGIDEYMIRINNITEYYHISSKKYKRNFYFSCFLRMSASSLIPVISLASEINWSTVVVSILAGVITISEGYVNISKAYDKWTKYRGTCNALWTEQRYFAMKAGIYTDDINRTELFVERCEGFIIEEANEWKIYIDRAKEMK